MYDKMLVIFWVLRDYLLVPPHNGVVQSTNISAVKAAEFNRYLSSFLQESKPPYSTHGWLCVHLILCYYYYYFFPSLDCGEGHALTAVREISCYYLIQSPLSTNVKGHLWCHLTQ